jgi:ankyrin repeat protein
MTPLFVLASEQGGLKPMERLLQLGADPNIRTNQGLTPLDIALARGEAEKIVLLKATPTT